MRPRFLGPLCLFAMLSIASAANAHFAWLAMDEDGHAIFFFGESIAERTYHMPEKLADTTILAWSNQTSRTPPMESVDSDALIGMKSAAPVGDAAVLSCSATYGIYQGSKLTYHCQHVSGSALTWPTKPNAKLPFQSLLKRRDDGGVVVTVMLKGKPLANVKVKLYCSDGHEEGAATTDAEGNVEFNGKEVEDGLNGLLISHVDPTSKGTLDETEYAGEAHYLSVTFQK